MNRRSYLKNFSTGLLGLGAMPLSSFGLDVRETKVDPGIYRLLFNENPDGPSKSAKKAIKANLDRAHRYCTFHPEDYTALKKQIAEAEGLKPEQVLLGHGSFEPLSCLASYFTAKEGSIIVPSPSFDVLGGIARKLGANVIPVEVKQNFEIDLERMEQKLDRKTSVVTLCNPNNPTGNALDDQQLRSFCSLVGSKSTLLIDEAYIQYLNNWRQRTMAPLIKEGKQILIARTFSKIYGMAGLRIGFLLGPEDVIKELEQIFTMGFPGNMPNALSVSAAIAALKDTTFIRDSRLANQERKEIMYDYFDRKGINFLKSEANFIYYQVKDFKKYRAEMRKRNIVLAGGWPTKPKWARVTMGNEQELSYFMDQMDQLI